MTSAVKMKTRRMTIYTQIGVILALYLSVFLHSHVAHAQDWQVRTQTTHQARILEHYLADIMRDPLNTDALERYIDELYLRSRLDLAITQLTARVHQSPNNIALYLVLGQLHMTQNQVAQANRIFRQAIDRDPENGAAWILFAESYRELSNPVQAIFALEQALTHLSRRGDIQRARMGLVELYLRAPEVDIARRYVDEYLHDNSGNTVTRLAYARALTRVGDWDDALTQYEWLIEYWHDHDHNRLAWLDEAADILVQLKRYSEAVDYYQRALRLNVRAEWQHRRIAQKLVRILGELSQWNEAYELFRQLVEKGHDDQQIFLDFVAVLMAGNQDEMASKIVDELMTRHGETAELLYELARLYNDYGKNEKAQGIYTRLAESSKNDVAMLENIADGFEIAGHLPDALALWTTLYQTTRSVHARKKIIELHHTIGNLNQHIESWTNRVATGDLKAAGLLVEARLFLRDPDRARAIFVLGRKAKAFTPVEESEFLSVLSDLFAQFRRFDDAAILLQEFIQNTETPSVEELKAAITLSTRRRDDDSLEHYVAVLEKDHSTDPTAMSFLGDLYAVRGELVRAEDFYVRAIATSDENSDAIRYRLASLFYNDQRFQDAQEQWTRVMRRSKSRDLVLKAGYCLIELAYMHDRFSRIEDIFTSMGLANTLSSEQLEVILAFWSQKLPDKHELSKTQILAIKNYVLSAIVGTNSGAQALAIRLAGELQIEESIPFLSYHIVQHDTPTAVSAALAFSKFDDIIDDTVLYQKLNSKNSAVRQRVLWSLAFVSDPKASELLQKILVEGQIYSERIVAGFALRNKDSRWLLESLSLLLNTNDFDARVVETVFYNLGHSGQNYRAEALVPFIEYPSRQVQFAAIYALAALGGGEKITSFLGPDQLAIYRAAKSTFEARIAREHHHVHDKKDYRNQMLSFFDRSEGQLDVASIRTFKPFPDRKVLLDFASGSP